MIRWYDYVLAFIAADFIMAGVYMSFTQSWVGGIFAWITYEMWDGYCNWRKKRESL
jgi:hypothetical protein